MPPPSRLLLLACVIGGVVGVTAAGSGAGGEPPSAGSALALSGDVDPIAGLIPLTEENELLLAVTIGPNLRGSKAVGVPKSIPADAYDGARASALDPGDREREANVLFVRTVKRGVFERRRGIPLNFHRRAERLITVRVPYEGDTVDRGFLAGIALPRYARRAVSSIIDTTTGEVEF